MRTPVVEAALNRVQEAARFAFASGATPRSILWTAAAYANGDDANWPTEEGRKLADRAASIFDPAEAKSATPPRTRATWLARIADAVLSRFGWKVLPR